MHLFKKKKPAKNPDLINALSDLETELIALETLADIVIKTDLDASMSIYLCERVAAHTETMRIHFRHAWNGA